MKPVPDAIMFRDVAPGIWDVKTVGEHRMAAHLEGGWMLLISSSQVKAEDIAAAYFADQMAWRLRERLPFSNRPRS
jgi:hypothetical protein